jgi:hypothetical protein
MHAFLRRFAIALILFSAAAALHAQLPVDNLAWRDRCKLLTSLDKTIQSGAIPQSLVSATRKVAGQKFITFAFDRAQNGEHNVACTLFYMGEIAIRAGNGGTDAITTRHAPLLAQGEAKVAAGKPLTTGDKMKRSSMKMHQARVPALTSADLQAVIDAADTLPISLSGS